MQGHVDIRAIGSFDSNFQSGVPREVGFYAFKQGDDSSARDQIDCKLAKREDVAFFTRSSGRFRL
jgi:hypothetical protein